jgi:Esterase-like activity of phytase
MSENRKNGNPIPFGALSGLAACPKRQRKLQGLSSSSTNTTTSAPVKGAMVECKSDELFTIEDGFYRKNRILTISTKSFPAEIVEEIYIKDTKKVFASALASAGYGNLTTRLINSDNTTNADMEGLTVSETYGGFWAVHEGAEARGRNPFIPNILFKLSSKGVIEEAILPPPAITSMQTRYGLEGVAEYGTKVVVVFQRALKGEPNPYVGIYDTVTRQWTFAYYPLDPSTSPNPDAFVGLSDITSVGGGFFLVVERDNQGGVDARVKRIYMIDINQIIAPNQILAKVLVRDLLPDLATATNGPIVEKVEGLTVDTKNNIWIVNDNDGVDDNNGEILLLNVGKFVLSDFIMG